MNFNKINELKPQDLNCNVFDVYSYDGLSMQELLCQFFTKINECVKTSNDTIDLASWLVNEGLKQEVALKLTTWLNDGTLENLINVTLFENLNNKIDNVSSQLAHITNNHLEYSVKDFKCDDGSFVLGDGLHDDTTGIQRAINQVSLHGGKLFFPRGLYKISDTLHLNTSNRGNKVIIEGDGTGVSIISMVNNKTAIRCEGYLYEIRELSLNGLTGKCDNGYGLHLLGGGRRYIKNLQINYFKHGIYQENSFDQLNIEKVAIYNSYSDGLYLDINDNLSCALLSINDCLLNDNIGCGLKVIQSQGQLINFICENTEMIRNKESGVYCSSTYDQPITGMKFISCDIEHIPAGHYGIYLNNVYKFDIDNCSFNIFDDNSLSLIYLKGCRDGFIKSPWISDNILINNKILIDKLCSQIYLMCCRQGYDKAIDFSIDDGLIPLSCVNLDKLTTKTSIKTLMRKEYNANSLEEDTSNNGLFGFKMKPAIQNSIIIPYEDIRPLRGINIMWFNLSENATGNVSFVCFNKSLEGNGTVYSRNTNTVLLKNVLNKTYINIGDINYDTKNGFTVFEILRDGSYPSDDFPGEICIFGVEFLYKY